MEIIWDIINITTAVITVARIIVVATPSKKDDKVLGKIEAVLTPLLNALSLSFGNNKK
tara:strand:- start:269 stop:442 length:174 start_codon:yes stop_codon:yes gene_type:complete